MPVLENPKHEAFAQSLAKGKSQAEAYADAGYAPSEPHASRLASNGKVAGRVAELLAKAADRTVVTVELIAKQLDEDRALAHQEGQSGAAVSASMGKAKLFGLLIDKAEVDMRHSFSEMSDDELDGEIAKFEARSQAAASARH